jgi:hypothetical protein
MILCVRRYRYRVAAGQCVRALRIDLQLAVLHHLQALPEGRFVCEDGEQQVMPILENEVGMDTERARR